MLNSFIPEDKKARAIIAFQKIKNTSQKLQPTYFRRRRA